MFRFFLFVIILFSFSYSDDDFAHCCKPDEFRFVSGDHNYTGCEGDFVPNNSCWSKDTKLACPDPTSSYHFKRYRIYFQCKSISECLPPKVVDPETQFCVDPPACPTGQHYDDNGVCVCDDPGSVLLDGVCTECPPNSHPDSSGFCSCDPGYNYDATSHTCTRCIPPAYYNPATGSCDDSDCAPPYVPADDYSTSYRCVLPDDDNGTDPGTDPGDDDNGGDSCPHPPTLHDDPFVGIMSFDDCIFSGGWVFSCPDSNDVACYRSDSNNTDPGDDNNGGNDDDDNSTGGIDSNGTDPGDPDLLDRERNSKLDTIIDKLDASNQIAKENGNSFAAGFRNLGGKLDTIDNTLKTGISSINDNLGSKLDAIKNSIDNKPVPEATDMTETNDLLRSINDRLHEDNQDKIDDIASKASSLESVVDQAIASVTANYNDIVAVMNGLTPPSLSSSGSCNLSVVVLGKTLDIGKGFRDALPILRPVVMFIFNLIFAVLLIRFSILAYRDIQLKAFALFS